MSRSAEEKAKEVVEEALTTEGCDVYDVLIQDVTEVIKQTRIDAIEECAKAAEKRTAHMSVDVFPHQVGAIVALVIRSLVSKEVK